MLFAIAIGVLSAFVILIAMSRINLKKFMGYPAAMDVLVTVVLIWMLHGSYVGMVAAVIGGLFFSGMITVIRKMYGYTKLERKGYRLVWVEYNGTWYERVQTRLNNQQGVTICSSLNLSRLWPLYIVGALILLSVV
jgi:hypothetical protein